MPSLMSWFATDRGRIFTRACVGFAAVAVVGNHVAINGPLLDQFRSVCQVYKMGEPKPLSSKVKQLVEEVLNDSKLTEEKKKKITFFNVIGHDTFHAGGLNSPWGAIVGIPIIFEDMKDINFKDLKVQGKDTIDWVVDGQDLLKALTLSDDAKKFALMREIYSCNFQHVFDNAIIGAFCILGPAIMAQRLNVRRDAFKTARLRTRSLWYAVYFSVGFLFYQLIKGPFEHLHAQKNDQLAAETGPMYLNGGIEFYRKLLLRNKALRSLLGPKGTKMFDENGNENFFLLAPRLPISKRLE
ncbi:Transmembrane protein 177, partial [Stegodyphus mimosarum]